MFVIQLKRFIFCLSLICMRVYCQYWQIINMYFVHSAEFQDFFERIFKRFSLLQSNFYRVFPHFRIRHFAHSGNSMNLRFFLNFVTISVSKQKIQSDWISNAVRGLTKKLCSICRLTKKYADSTTDSLSYE